MSKLSHSNQETMEIIERNRMKKENFGAEGIEACECVFCRDGSIHDSDCAVHNEPAYPNGPCNCSLSKKFIPQEMVDRFLSWPLPKGFSPDCGVSFDGRGKDARGYEKQWPVGTNLLSADQAREMLEYVVTPTLRYERLLLSNAEKEVAELSAPPSDQPAGAVVVPIHQLEHWAEYWNGNANEKSMTDALEHILDEIDAVLQAAREAK